MPYIIIYYLRPPPPNPSHPSTVRNYDRCFSLNKESHLRELKLKQVSVQVEVTFKEFHAYILNWTQLGHDVAMPLQLQSWILAPKKS